MTAAPVPAFSAPGLHALLARLDADALDRLDFGVIGFDLEPGSPTRYVLVQRKP